MKINKRTSTLIKAVIQPLNPSNVTRYTTNKIQNTTKSIGNIKPSPMAIAFVSFFIIF